jgi:hypothetical protein
MLKFHSTTRAAMSGWSGLKWNLAGREVIWRPVARQAGAGSCKKKRRTWQTREAHERAWGAGSFQDFQFAWGAAGWVGQLP